MSYNLFLDDVRQPQVVEYYLRQPPEVLAVYRKCPWIIVRNYDEFVACVNLRGLPEKLSLDHDLALIHYDSSTWSESFKYEEKTGLDCVKWLCSYCMANELDFPYYWVHSQNPVGAENMTNYIENFKKHR